MSLNINSSTKKIFSKIHDVRENLKKIGVEKIGLFGSYSRGEADKSSDIDIIIIFKPKYKSFDNFFKALDVLENSTHKNVDLVTPESLSTYIKPYIDKEVLYETL